MRKDHDTPHEWSDDVLRTMRSIYAPPAQPSYWDALERRVMERVAKGGTAEWWSFFDGWTRAGLVAAGIVAIITAAIALRTHEAEVRMAYESAIEAPEGTLAEIESESIIGGTGARSREESLRFLLPR